MNDDLFSGLNPAQQRAVQAVDGPVLVLAGPGSGKTRVLTHRVAYLIRALQIDPYQILAVTFTNKAAREMKQRLVQLVGEEAAYALTVGTFHSLCARFLRRDSVHLGRERDFVIYDSDDQERLMRRVVRELNLDEKKYAPRAMLSRISSAKNELVGPAEYARLNHTYLDEIVARCYERYQHLLRQSNALDFDDLLVEMVHLFDQHPAVLAHYQRRYAYLLVDEYQDTNRAQYMLVKHLAAQRHNLFAVGDNDQSIYGWRGADIRNILQFEQDYPNAQVILLEQNYRSTQAILDTAQAVLAGGGQQKHRKHLWTENGAGATVSLHEGYDQDAEATFVAEEIARLVASGEVSYGDCAVMYRVNAQSRALEETFMQHGLRYQIIGGTRFYERKEIRDVIAYLRLVANPYDDSALTRILNWPGRGIGDRSEAELIRWANELGVPLYQALREIEVGTSPFAARTRTALLGFLATLDQILTMRATLPLDDLFDAMIGRLAVREVLLKEYDPEEAEDRWRNVQELRNVISNYIHLPIEAQLPTFLEDVALVADVDKLDAKADAVTCITLHQAKGLEYPVVFLVGLEEGLLPHSRALAEREQVEEERRLLYVGMTRARQRLYLCYAFRRATFGRFIVTTRTRFLADIPKELLTQPHKRPATPPTAQTSMLTSRSRIITTPPATPAPPSSITFAPGQAVVHPMFGEGVVVSSRLIENDEEVTVMFADKERRLLASFAKLEHHAG
ncbi:ATP-dependent helicase [Candidatus Oscillochloris fontis]|uniref:ATP-dependent helicase n=1 Tax=Candidatus Oscillochloris fontis TaxID=2496868 RepID=UPI00101D9AAB|nr:UvrD-helicase domain-containing protein [Candidatus Oscillochloris fontis]